MKPMLLLRAILGAALCLVLMSARIHAQVAVDFNTPTGLHDHFGSMYDNWINDDNGGIGGTGGVTINANSDLYTMNPGIPAAGVGTVYTVSAYFYNGANSGFGGLGFATATSNDYMGWGFTQTGVGMVTHAGGGMFASNAAEYLLDYPDDILVDGTWYKIMFTATVTGANTVDLEYKIWSSDPNGGSLVLVTDQTMTGVVNANVASAEILYPYFSAVDERMYEVDNFFVANGPLPIQLASLTAAPAGGSSAKLVWKTASETNNYGFYVERSANRSTGFVAVSGLIPGHGTSTTGFSYEYADKSVPSGNQYYRLKQVDLDNSVHYSDAVMLSTTGVAESAPIVFALSQNYPNPFNPSTQFRFSVAKSGFTTLVVYNAIGQEVSRIFNGPTEAGKYYTARLDGTGLASGVYFARLQSGIETQMKKIVLMK